MIKSLISLFCACDFDENLKVLKKHKIRCYMNG